MARVTNTFVTTNPTASKSPVGNREELSDVVNRITPEDTPLYSMMSKGTCNSIFPEWEIDELASPVVNAQIEGDEFTFGEINPVKRLGNATQIFRKDFIVSKTQDAVSNAGSAEQTKYQTLKKGIEMRKDIELAMLANTGTVKTDTGSAGRKFGSLQTWLETNTLRFAGVDANTDGDFTDSGDTAPGADGGYTASTQVTSAVTAGGAQRAFEKSHIDEVMESLYQEGGNCRSIMLSPYAKRVFSTFMSNSNVAPQRYSTPQSGQTTIIGAADMYLSDFGMVSVVPNRVMGHGADAAAKRASSSTVYFLDPSMLEFKFLRPISRVNNLANVSDATPFAMIGEGTLCVKNEAGLGVVADIYGLTASS
jgi:hypothetical protein